MEYDKFGSQSEERTGLVDFLVIPLLAPIFLFLIGSCLIPQASLLPLMLVITLCYLALRLSVPAIAWWMAVYMVIVLWVSFHPIKPAQTLPYPKPYVKAAFILIGGGVACLLACHRTRLQQSNRALFKMISALPSAVVVSDVSGSILLMNRVARQLVEGRFHALSGLSFFSTFAAQEDQGREIAKYVGYFQADEAGPFSTVLHTRGERPLILHVSITIITLDKTRYAMTVIEKAAAQVPVDEAQGVSSK